MYRYKWAPDTASEVCCASCMHCTLVLGSWIHARVWVCVPPFIHTVSLSTAKAASVRPQNNKHIGFCALQQYRVRFGMPLLQPVPSPSLCPSSSPLPPASSPRAPASLGPCSLSLSPPSAFSLHVSLQPFIISVWLLCSCQLGEL